MMFRYNVHFEYDKDIEISVIIETTYDTDTHKLRELAIDKLTYNGLAAIIHSDMTCTIDLLERR